MSDKLSPKLTFKTENTRQKLQNKVADFRMEYSIFYGRIAQKLTLIYPNTFVTQLSLSLFSALSISLNNALFLVRFKFIKMKKVDRFIRSFIGKLYEK